MHQIIYKITCLKNNKVYIGKHKHNNLNSRFNDHLISLRNNKHYNKHLQRAFNKYGEESFTCEQLDWCCIGQDVILNNLEKYWINEYKSNNPEFGFNKTFGGDGVLPTKETRKKMSNSRKGKTPWNKGIKCDNISKNNCMKRNDIKEKHKKACIERSSNKEYRKKLSESIRIAHLNNNIGENISAGLNKYYENVDKQIINERNQKIKETLGKRTEQQKIETYIKYKTTCLRKRLIKLLRKFYEN